MIIRVDDQTDGGHATTFRHRGVPGRNPSMVLGDDTPPPCRPGPAATGISLEWTTVTNLSPALAASAHRPSLTAGILLP
jgi:hypothetical protein